MVKNYKNFHAEQANLKIVRTWEPCEKRLSLAIISLLFVSAAKLLIRSVYWPAKF
jgi:hypothetical protein